VLLESLISVRETSPRPALVALGPLYQYACAQNKSAKVVLAIKHKGGFCKKTFTPRISRRRRPRSLLRKGAKQGRRRAAWMNECLPCCVFPSCPSKGKHKLCECICLGPACHDCIRSARTQGGVVLFQPLLLMAKHFWQCGPVSNPSLLNTTRTTPPYTTQANFALGPAP
jgi:hypothetical protein